MKETGIVPEANKLGATIKDFVGENEAYYTKEFDKIQSATEFPWSWNKMAAIVGPFWGAARGLWGVFLDLYGSGDFSPGTDRQRFMG